MARKKNTTRKDGRISVQIYLGRDENDKRKYKTVYGKTQKEADAKAEELRLSLKKGYDITSEKDTFEEWARKWLSIKSDEISNGQLTAYKCSINHLNRYIGDKPISKIKYLDIQTCITDLANQNPNTKKPSSKATLKMIKIAASQVFDLAINNQVISFNPTTKIKIPNSAPETKRRALTKEEQQWIIDTDHRARRAAMIMMYAGLRRGELIPLFWSDIDFNLKTITVNKAVEIINGVYVLKDQTKTKAGMRIISIPAILIDFLKKEPKESIYVCVNAKNELHTESSWTSMWDSYLSDLNLKYGSFVKRPTSKFDPKGIPFVIPKITPHWLRHTYATMLYFAGIDILTAKEQLGHSNIQTTMQIYTHLDKWHKQKSMSKLDTYLESASQMQVSNS